MVSLLLLALKDLAAVVRLGMQFGVSRQPSFVIACHPGLPMARAWLVCVCRWGVSGRAEEVDQATPQILSGSGQVRQGGPEPCPRMPGPVISACCMYLQLTCGYNPQVNNSFLT